MDEDDEYRKARTKGRGRGQDLHHRMTVVQPDQPCNVNIDDAYRLPPLQPIVNQGTMPMELDLSEESIRLGREEQEKIKEDLKRKYEDKARKLAEDSAKKREVQRKKDLARLTELRNNHRSNCDDGPASSSSHISKSASRTYYKSGHGHQTDNTHSSTFSCRREYSTSSSHRRSRSRSRLAERSREKAVSPDASKYKAATRTDYRGDQSSPRSVSERINKRSSPEPKPKRSRVAYYSRTSPSKARQSEHKRESRTFERTRNTSPRERYSRDRRHDSSHRSNYRSSSRPVRYSSAERRSSGDSRTFEKSCDSETKSYQSRGSDSRTYTSTTVSTASSSSRVVPSDLDSEGHQKRDDNSNLIASSCSNTLEVIPTTKAGEKIIKLGAFEWAPKFDWGNPPPKPALTENLEANKMEKKVPTKLRPPLYPTNHVISFEAERICSMNTAVAGPRYSLALPPSRLNSKSGVQSCIHIGRNMKEEFLEMFNGKTREAFNSSLVNREFKRRRRNGTVKLLEEKSRLIVGYLSRFYESRGKSATTPDTIIKQISTFRLTSLPSKPCLDKLSLVYEYTSRSKLQEALEEIEKSNFIGVDFEYSYREPRYPAVLQFSSVEYGTLVVLPESLNNRCYSIIKRILENPNNVKIVFGSSNDFVNLKVFKIFPVGCIDVQHFFEILTGVYEKVNLKFLSEYLINLEISKTETSALFESRDSAGHLPLASLNYSAKDSICHLLCFYALIDKLIDGASGDELEERKSQIISIINQSYAQQTSQLSLKDPNFRIPEKTKKDDNDLNHKFQNKVKPILQNFGSRAVRLGGYLERYRNEMHLKLCEMTKFNVLPNGTILELCENLPKDIGGIGKILSKNEHKYHEKRFDDQLVELDLHHQPLSDVVKKQAWFLLKIINASADPEKDFELDIFNHANSKCRRCRVDTCLTSAVCINEKYVRMPDEPKYPDRPPKVIDPRQGTSQQVELENTSKKFKDDQKRKDRNKKQREREKKNGKARIRLEKRIAAGRMAKSVLYKNTKRYYYNKYIYNSNYYNYNR